MPLSRLLARHGTEPRDGETLELQISNGNAHVQCLAPSEAGSLLVPSAALMQLPTGAGSIGAFMARIAELEASNADVRLHVLWPFSVKAEYVD